MTREQIERAADVYAAKTSPTYTNGDYDRIAIAEAFEQGAQWRINSVWHDYSETPKMDDTHILIERKTIYGENNYEVVDDIDEYLSWAKDMRVQRWAYVDDLLPEREEE